MRRPRFHGQPQFSILTALSISITEPRVILLDAILTAFLGALIAYFSIEPTTKPQAVAAGLAFTGILNSTGIGFKNER